MAKSSKRPKTTVSLADIAKVAGVHKMTVSRALRDSERVTEETRKRIKKIADKMGYKPSSLVTNVMGQIARRRLVQHAAPLALLVDFDLKQLEMDPVGTQVVAGAKERAEALGFGLELIQYHGGTLSDKRIDQILTARGIEGILINVAAGRQSKLNLNWSRLSVATSGSRLTEPENLPRVQSDAPLNIARILKECDARGYKRIGYCYGSRPEPQPQDFNENIFRQYQASLSKARRLPVFDYRVEGPPNIGEYCERHQPDVIVSLFNGAIEWLEDAGIRIPDDMGFVTNSTAERESRVSGMYLDKGTITGAAIEVVVSNLINGHLGLSDRPSRTLIPGEWVEGTTLCPRT